MSTFDEASLVFIPSGYKTSKAYSVKPSDGSGDLAFTRSNDTATRVGPDGLIEKVRTNLNLYSQDFTNAAYVTAGYGSRASVVANTTANPLTGAQDADTATFTAGAAQSRLLQQFTGLSTTNKYTYSLYVKAGTKSTVKIYGEVTVVGVLADFNLATASVIGTPTLCTASIVSAGSGWYRCSITFNAQGAGSADCGPVSWAGEDGTLFIYGAQLEVSDFGATPYIATTTAAVSVGPVANVPRLDYLNSSCPRLLLEPQRTNLGLWSEQFNNAGWTNAATTITANYGVSPDGYTNADRFQQTTIGALQQTISVTASTAYTVSFYCKLLGGTSASLGVYNFSGSAFIFQDNLFSSLVLNEWVRVTRTFTTPVGCTSITGELWRDSTIDCLVYGFQMEAGAYATSYIPTLGAAVTRGADAASKTGISSLIGQTEGTLFIDFIQAAATSSVVQIQLNDGSNANRVQIENGSNGVGVLYVFSGGSLTGQIILGTFTAGTRYKIAATYKLNDFAVYVNGVLAGTDTSGAVPVSMSRIDLGAEVGTSYTGYKLNQALLFKTRLSNADLAALTA